MTKIPWERKVVAVTLPGGHTYPGAQSPVHKLLINPWVEPYLPAGHPAVHPAVVRPIDIPYRPAGHAVQAAAAATLYCPTPHMMAVGRVDPAGHAKPAVQGPVHDAVVRLVFAPYLPPGHGNPVAAVLGTMLAQYRPAMLTHGPEHVGEVRPCVAPYCPTVLQTTQVTQDRASTTSEG
jgi:hypothetical protein